jgi:uncharacterized protein YndB with AHSA1/START domain
MEPKIRVIITVQSTINTTVTRAWKCWTSPDDIVNWNVPSELWHTSWAKNELRPGGRFIYRMETWDGSSGFDFEGTYDHVVYCKQITFTIGDGRKVLVTFSGKGSRTEVTEVFETESTNPVDAQREGWQNILDNFKKYAERTNQKLRK